MLRYSIFAIGIVMGTSAFSQMPHGFFIGAGAGMGQSAVKTQDIIDYIGNGANYTDRNSSKTISKIHPDLLLNLGYEYTAANHYSIGISLFAQYEASAKYDTAGYNYNFNGSSATHYSDGVSTELKSLSYGFMLSPGYHFTGKDAVFVNLGMKFINTATTYGKTWYTLNSGPVNDTLAATTKENTLSGFMYGLGYDRKLNPHLSLFAEVNYVQFAKNTFKRSEVDKDLADRDETYITDINNLNVDVGVRYHL